MAYPRIRYLLCFGTHKSYQNREIGWIYRRLQIFIIHVWCMWLKKLIPCKHFKYWFQCLCNAWWNTVYEGKHEYLMYDFSIVWDCLWFWQPKNLMGQIEKIRALCSSHNMIECGKGLIHSTGLYMLIGPPGGKRASPKAQ